MTKALFPEQQTLDISLEKYLNGSVRLGWSVYDMASPREIAEMARPEQLTDVQIGVLKSLLFVEDQLPHYMCEYLRLFGDTDCSQAQQIINRQVLRYAFQWAAEEDRHSHLLSMYLINTGIEHRDELEAELVRVRSIPYRLPYEDPRDIFAYLCLQERATQLYYSAFARELDEPLLSRLLCQMASDEARHARFFSTVLLGSVVNPNDISDVIERIASDFRMPVQFQLPEHRRRIIQLMRAAPGYRHEAVFSHMRKSIEHLVVTQHNEK